MDKCVGGTCEQEDGLGKGVKEIHEKKEVLGKKVVEIYVWKRKCWVNLLEKADTSIW